MDGLQFDVLHALHVHRDRHVLLQHVHHVHGQHAPLQRVLRDHDRRELLQRVRRDRVVVVRYFSMCIMTGIGMRISVACVS